jgi:hypothetical protein
MFVFRRALAPCLFAVIILASEVATGAPPSAAASPAAHPDLILVQAPVIRPGPLSARFPKGSRLVRLPAAGASPENLTPHLFAAADPEVSFDGSKVLFAAKRDPAAVWQIWEMNVDGSQQRQLTHCPSDCLRPAYLAHGEIVFTAESTAAWGRTTQLYVSNGDGSGAHPITFGPGDFRLETVMENGRLLVSARSPLLPSHTGEISRGLYTLRIDGSGLAVFRDEHQPHTVRADAQEMADGSVVFVKSHNSPARLVGELTIIHRGAVHNSPLGSPPVFVTEPRTLSANELLVARPVAASRTGKGKLALYAFDTARGRFVGLIYKDPKFSSLAAVPVAAHPVARWYWSTLNPALRAGYFICLDSHLAEVPLGRLTASVSKLRVLSLDPKTNREHSLGEAPVEKDGSFYIAVPPDVPLRFELLDAHGRVIRAQHSWIWSRSGEEHGCVGCHEDRSIAPPNRWPLALRSFNTPTKLGVVASAPAEH